MEDNGIVGMQLTECIEGPAAYVKVWRYPRRELWLVDGPGPTIDVKNRQAAHDLACAIADGVVRCPWFAEGG